MIKSSNKSHLTPLNLPDGETTDSFTNESAERHSPPLESLSRFIGRLGEVKNGTLEFCNYAPVTYK